MDFRDLLQSLTSLSEATKETPKGKTHTADAGGYGRKFDTDEEGDEKKKPAATAAKRGKGRPKKGSDDSGEVKKYDFSAFGVKHGKDVKLPKHDKSKTTKHSLKEYIEETEVSLSENGITVKPMPGASQIIGADGKPIGTADQSTANLIKTASEKGTLNLAGSGDEQGMAEAELSEIGDTPAGLEKIQDYRAKVGRQFHKTGEYDVRNPNREVNPFDARDKEQFPASKQYTRVAGADRARQIAQARQQGMPAKFQTQYEAVAEEKDLPGKQDKLDVAKPKGKLDAKDFAALRAKKKVKESLSFNEMSEEAQTTAQEMLAELQSDIETFVNTGHCSDKLEAFLKVHGHSKKKLADEGIEDRVGFNTPPPIDKNPMTQNPMTTPAFARKQQSLGMPIKSPGEEKPFGFMKEISAPMRTFESKDMKDIQVESWEKELNSLLNEGITVSSSTGQQGSPDSVSVNATDADAEQLLQVLRQAGVGVFGGGEQEHSGYGAPVNTDAEGHGTEPEISPTVVGDGDDMMALIKKMTGIDSGEEGQPSGTLEPTSGDEHGSDYEDEEGHGHGEETCDECGSADCQCDDEVDEGYEETDEGAGVMHFKKQQAEKAGQDHFKLGDKEYPVKEDDKDSSIVPALAGGALGYGIGSGALDGVGAALGAMVGLEEEDMEEGNFYGKNVVDAKAAGKKRADLDGDGDMEQVKEEGEETCNECGGAMYEGHSCDSEQVEEGFANEPDEELMKLRALLGMGNDLHRQKQNQSVGNPTKVTFETKLLKDSSNLLVDWQKLSGIK